MLYAPLASVRTSPIFVMFAPDTRILASTSSTAPAIGAPSRVSVPFSVGRRLANDVVTVYRPVRLTTAPSPPFGVPRCTTVRTAGTASVVRFPAASSSTTPIDRVPSGSVAVSSVTVVPTSSGHGCGHLNACASAGST